MTLPHFPKCFPMGMAGWGRGAGEWGFVPSPVRCSGPSSSRLGSSTPAPSHPHLSPTSISGSPWLFIAMSADCIRSSLALPGPDANGAITLHPVPSVTCPVGLSGPGECVLAERAAAGAGVPGGAKAGGWVGAPAPRLAQGREWSQGSFAFGSLKPPLGHPEERPRCCAECHVGVGTVTPYRPHSVTLTPPLHSQSSLMEPLPGFREPLASCPFPPSPQPFP